MSDEERLKVSFALGWLRWMVNEVALAYTAGRGIKADEYYKAYDRVREIEEWLRK